MFKDQSNGLVGKNKKENVNSKKKCQNHTFDIPNRIHKSYFVVWMKTNRLYYRFYCFVAVDLCAVISKSQRRYELSEKLFQKKMKRKKNCVTPKGRSSLCKKRPNGTHIVTSNESDNNILCVLVTLLTRAASGSQAITFWNEAPLKRPSSTNTKIFNVYFIFWRNFNSNHFVDIENNSTVFVIWLYLNFFSVSHSF